MFIKIGYLEFEQLTKVVQANTKFIDGIVAINTIGHTIRDKSGKDFFPPNPVKRSMAGVSGTGIKPFAMEVVRGLNELRSIYKYDYDILGVGGVTTSQDVQNYLDLGANGVQSCTGAWINPNLAIGTRLYTGTMPDTTSVITTIGENGNHNNGNQYTMTGRKFPKIRKSDDTIEISPGYGRRKNPFLPVDKDIIRDLAESSKIASLRRRLWQLFDLYNTD